MLVCRNCVLMQKLVVSIKCDGVVRRLKLLAQLWTVFHNMDHYKKLILLLLQILSSDIGRQLIKSGTTPNHLFPWTKSALLNEGLSPPFDKY